MSKLTQRGSKTGLLKAFGLGASLVGVAAFWLAKVNEVVPDPYLVCCLLSLRLLILP